MSAPSVLAVLIASLEAQKNDDDRGAAKALQALGALAAVEVPRHGVFAAAERDELFAAIERIAIAHLGFADSKRAFTVATNRVADLAVRDRIQVTAIERQIISDRAYFYAGLAFGVTVTRLGASW
jgi:hypothetical protein